VPIDRLVMAHAVGSVIGGVSVLHWYWSAAPQATNPTIIYARLNQAGATTGDRARSVSLTGDRGFAVVADQSAGEADQDWRQGREPWPPLRVPDGRSRGICTDVQRNSHAHCPVAGATRTSMKRPRIKFDGQERQRRASMKAKQRAPAPANQATHSLGCAWHPVEGGLLSWMLNNRQLRSLAPESWNVGRIRVHLLFAYVVARIVPEHR
jgi:hypothetical protein